MTGRRRWAAAAAFAVLGTAVAYVVAGDTLWRAAYPHLPPRLQAVPYRLRGWLAPAATPRPLPTAAPAARATAVGAGIATPPATRTAPPALPTASAAAPTAPLPPQAALDGVRHSYQTWNNCGPATISMALSVLGLDEGQAKAAVRLKPNPDDKNVGLDELARYARERGAAAEVRVNGTIDDLRRLVALGVPVVVETWFVPEPGDEMGHYRLVTGYDAAAGTLRLADSYLGPERTVAATALDAEWRAFNRAFLVLSVARQEPDVAAVLGPSGPAMWLAAASRARDEIDAAPDAFGWFNLGESLQALGDSAGAAAAFDRARAIGLPWRMLWYQFGPFAAYAAQGRWSDVAALAEANLANAPELEESWTWLGHARQAAGDEAGAIAAWRRATALNDIYVPAREALATAEAR